MGAASDTQNAQGILLLLPLKSLPLPPTLDLVLILDQVRDPGNLGTLLRGAAAAGVGAVFLPPEGVDPFSPKVLRGAMGAHFRLPIHSLSYAEIEAHCREHGLAVLVAAANQGQSHTSTDLTRPTALIIGGEADGPSQAVQKLAAGHIHIPMPGESESLNAAMAGTILLFEVVRQRGQL
jgi:TrmH family RNA methyltransferase